MQTDGAERKDTVGKIVVVGSGPAGCSAALYAAVYLMINPGWMRLFLGQEVAKAFGGALL